MDQVKEQLTREPRGLPKLKMPYFGALEHVLDSNVSDYVLTEYNPMDSIKADMAV